MKRLVTGLLICSALVAMTGAASVGYVATAYPTAFVTRFKVWEHAPARVLPERQRSLDTLYWRSYGRMTREDLSAIYTYLRAQKPVIHRVVKRDRG